VFGAIIEYVVRFWPIFWWFEYVCPNAGIYLCECSI